ncbi:MAG: bifunctional phosphopantothenoylcysteine decarboxylase/phosphopantothenate--cysteine ligase CoaBC [Candidatus Nitrohelix vancouverensis]|uniref:Coenzyme A biosynthesis bifunctional protein CoaBC n=1 Tax=Candidatus Nitrohelix vancouverensis TaxID=2705534 RepID=A0A7T0C3E1_9BACT|nr:MAG: bifunctional phosphopantothenoylcysteine decarboxylase/phosphopantothenate--cysteine ligase CoaBC [Candidatus Nitrohelix vancouverensis]
MAGELKGKNIALGVAGGIACYKAAELLRLLAKEGAGVYVTMSQNAHRFVAPLTFEALSGNRVYDAIFESDASSSMEHIKMSETADLLLVAPATASSLGKMANGLADDALSSLFISFRGPVVVCPAMNDGMYANPAVQANLKTLKERGVHVVEPDTGELACGSIGPGRLAELERIVAETKGILNAKEDLSGLRFLVTAGPTREFLDPVRYISNPSSGKMGYALAEQARQRGAQVDLISGPVQLEAPSGVTVHPCVTAAEMQQQVQKRFGDCDVLIMTAAVGDFAPDLVQKEKMKKAGGDPLTLTLRQTVDILKEAGNAKTHQYVVGFAAETQNIVESAKEKLVNKGADMIVANDVSAPGIGFQSDANQVTLVFKDGSVTPLALASKRDIANAILDHLLPLLSKG